MVKVGVKGHAAAAVGARRQKGEGCAAPFGTSFSDPNDFIARGKSYFSSYLDLPPDPALDSAPAGLPEGALLRRVPVCNNAYTSAFAHARQPATTHGLPNCNRHSLCLLA